MIMGDFNIVTMIVGHHMKGTCEYIE